MSNYKKPKVQTAKNYCMFLCRFGETISMKRLLATCLTLLGMILLSVSAYVVIHKIPDASVDVLATRWAQPPSTFIDVAGMSIHLRDEGPKNDALPILLLHGTSASLHTWDGWTEALRDEHRIIRFDLPAFGLTGPSPNNDYSIESYVSVVIAVLDTLGIEEVVLGGNSLGGYIAWATAVLHPNRVKNLILVDASGYPSTAASVPISFKIAQTPVLNTLLRGFMPRSLVKRSVENVYGNPNLVTDELVERYAELNTREGNRQALLERFKQTQAGPMADRAKEITVDTLIIWGEKDKLIPPEPSAQRFAKELQNSTLLMFEDLGHVPHEEDPIATVSAVKTFLSRVKNLP